MKFLEEGIENSREANHLFIEAFDWHLSQRQKTIIQDSQQPVKERYYSDKAIYNEQLFPPCIQLGLSGLDDGKKRFLFISINFLQKMGWKLEEIESRLISWNKNNKKPLLDAYIKSQIAWFKKSKNPVLPPNCNHPAYMLGIGICKPDHFCKQIKNPVSYPTRKISVMKQPKPKASSKR